MTSLAWTSDVHLNFLSDDDVVKFAQTLAATNSDSVVISGDISEAKTVIYHLAILEKVLQRPIYFVLGNHDFYGGDIEGTRKNVAELHKLSPFLKYLTNTTYTMIGPTTAIVGHDCWYDGLNGNNKDQTVELNDWMAIKDYRMNTQSGMYSSPRPSRQQVIEVSKKLAHVGVLHLQNAIKQATRYAQRIIVVSHVPPFVESHVYNGKVGEANMQPWFTSRMLGDLLLQASKAYPDKQFVSLSGHTHGRYVGNHAANLEVHVAGARYNAPALEKIIAV